MWVREVSRFCTMRVLNNFPSITIFTLYYYNNLEEFHIMKSIFFFNGYSIYTTYDNHVIRSVDNAYHIEH